MDLSWTSLEPIGSSAYYACGGMCHWLGFCRWQRSSCTSPQVSPPPLLNSCALVACFWLALGNFVIAYVILGFHIRRMSRD